MMILILMMILMVMMSLQQTLLVVITVAMPVELLKSQLLQTCCVVCLGILYIKYAALVSACIALAITFRLCSKTWLMNSK